MLWPLLSFVAVSVTPPPAEVGSGGPAAEGAVPTESAEVFLSEVLASCEKALGEGECFPVGEKEANWRAEVVFSSDAVQVTLSRPNRVIIRRLEFLPADTVKQRRVAAGLLVAAMTAAARLSEPERSLPPEEPKPAPPPEPPPAQPKPVPPQESARPPEQRLVSLELAGVVAPTLGAPHWGGGGRVGALLWVGRRWGLGGDGTYLYSVQSGLETVALTGALGPRFSLLGSSKVDWWLGAQAVIDSMRVRDEAVSGQSKTALRGGARLQTSWGFQGPAVSPFVGAGLTVLSPGLTLQRDGEELHTAPPVLGAVFLGLRWNL